MYRLNVHEHEIFFFFLNKQACPYPAVPSFPVMVEIPLNVPLANGGMVVCMRTLTASKGHKAMSAINSADALALR